MAKRRVLLTGATGVMGTAGLKELVARADRFDVTVLVRDTAVNRKKMARYGSAVRIVWGDLMCYDDVARAVEGADYVLHVGGMVSPFSSPQEYSPPARAVNSPSPVQSI